MNHQVPNSVIGAVASVIADHYYSHSKLDTLEVLGSVIQEYMDQEPPSSLFGGPLSTKVTEGQARINAALAKNQLVVIVNIAFANITFANMAFAFAYLSVADVNVIANSNDC